MRKKFFLCQHPVRKGSNNLLGINLDAINFFLFSPDLTPSLTIEFQGSRSVTLSGKDALRLARYMHLNLPQRTVSSWDDIEDEDDWRENL